MAPPVRRSYPQEWVGDLLRALEDWVPAEQLCRDVGLTFDTNASRIPCEPLLRALDRAAEVSGDALLGLHLAERLRPRGVLAYLTRVQQTVRQAVAALTRFQHLLYPNPSVVVIGRRGEGLLILFWPDRDTHTRHLIELSLALVYLEAKRGTVPVLRLNEVRFRHPAAATETEYRRVFAAPVRFNQGEDALVFPCSALDHQLRGFNPTVATFAEHPARSQTEIDDGVPFRERVALIIRSSLLASEECPQDIVCEHLSISRRTLQRRLWREQTSFTAVRNWVQKAVVLDLLTLPILNADDIRRRSGFVSVDALCAAVQGWTGQPLGR